MCKKDHSVSYPTFLLGSDRRVVKQNSVCFFPKLVSEGLIFIGMVLQTSQPGASGNVTVPDPSQVSPNIFQLVLGKQRGSHSGEWTRLKAGRSSLGWTGTYRLNIFTGIKTQPEACWRPRSVCLRYKQGDFWEGLVEAAA